jgi:uncharacterized protein
MTSTLAPPGLSVVVERARSEPAPLRSDVAGFIGRARRGPVRRSGGGPYSWALRVEGRGEFEAAFGGLRADASTTYAVRGFFENGGQVAYVLRVAGPDPRPAEGVWQVGRLDADGAWDGSSPARGGFAATAYRVVATSPGTWANATQVEFRYLAGGATGAPEVEVRVAAPGEPVEHFPRLPPREVAERLEASSLIRLVPLGQEVPEAAVRDRGPLSLRWRVELDGGSDPPPDRDAYLEAVATLADVPEVALVALPDLHGDLPAGDVEDVVAAALAASAPLLDRLVVLDVPRDRADAPQARAWAETMRDGLDPALLRAAAVYHPWLRVRDPLGSATAPVRDVPPAGHVAGLISRLDRERGAHHTPANATLFDAVDLERGLEEAEQLTLYGAGVNPLRCQPGSGLQVWGGRTLDPAPGSGGRFVAHRRLLHRLVRAMRRVADPLVFDVNGPELRLTLVRGVTTVLLAAFNAGALRGARPEEAFRVRCDDTTNPPDQQEREPGGVVCEVEVAPADPMERIELRLLLGQEGRLEVIEA